MRLLTLLAFLSLSPLPLAAGSFVGDVIILGEYHDNPHHHARQAEIVAEVAPRAIVFEMLTTNQAARHKPGADQDRLSALFGWEDSGWPSFSLYYPIFAAAPDARVFGAGVPRDEARQVRESGIAFVFGIGAGAYGLTDPLPSEEQASREAEQMAAHCDALPETMLPFMVDFQRLRDARLAQKTVRALELTGGPVVVITGNGHARRDRGMPVYLERVKPEARIVSLGQGEEGSAPPPGDFDVIRYAPSVERGDPCEAFR
ncbi:ChaN family lipoprotein [uncultured Roseobacter sp.]|uniref:ChaN family lipoprotein n=1 Tax=uncultured Roseobacter sp. TaxID=114847 RepID=UPI002609FA9F|nr:ChaN family lipoprotein [uncultured Roseobacter sp.]